MDTVTEKGNACADSLMPLIADLIDPRSHALVKDALRVAYRQGRIDARTEHIDNLEKEANHG